MARIARGLALFVIQFSSDMASPAWAGYASRGSCIEAAPNVKNHNGTHLLIGIADSLGTMSNRIGEDIPAPSGLAQTLTCSYGALGRPLSLVGISHKQKKKHRVLLAFAGIVKTKDRVVTC